MKKIICLPLFLICLQASAQIPVKYDSMYTTIFADDLCKLMSKKDVVLIDVRTPGEYSDTSQHSSLNMGRLYNAVNIPVDTLQKNIALLDPYKNKTLVFYCSHSQRSRRVSKLLSENGFTDFYNLNGGMSVLNQMRSDEFPCKEKLLQSNLKYRNVSNAGLSALIKNNNNLQIVDIRPASMYESKDSLAENNLGHIKNAVNIPYSFMKGRLNEIDKAKPVLIYSNSGDGDAARSATFLTENGYKNVHVLLAGYNVLLASDADASIESPAKFRITDATGALKLLKKNNDIIVFDTRQQKEYESKMTGNESFKNLGHIRNAINLEERDFNTFNFPADKNIPILIYGRGEAYRLANKLSSQGYTNVYVLRNLYEFIASAFNIKGNRDALLYLKGHEGLY